MKRVYETGDHIVMTVNVSNATAEDKDGIMIQNLSIPGYHTVNNASLQYSVDEVPEGQTVSFTTEYEPNTVAQAPAATENSNNDNADDDKSDDHEHHSSDKTETTTTATVETTTIATEEVPLADTVVTDTQQMDVNSTDVVAAPKTGAYVQGADGDLVVTSDNSGKYACALVEGNYTLECVKEGYITYYANITSGYTAENTDIAMSAELSGDEYRIVLTWGERPEDLDSHLMLPNKEHIYFSDTQSSEVDGNGKPIAQLDVDDTSSYGPETITFKQTMDGTYHYYVYNYDGDSYGKLTDSGATVKIYKGAESLGEYHVPTGCEGRYWNLFEITGSSVKVINAVGDRENVTENQYATATAALEEMTEVITVEETEEVTTEEVTTEEITTEETEETEEVTEETTVEETTVEETTVEESEEVSSENQEELSEEEVEAE